MSTARRAVIYARLSITRKDGQSVSIERQIESARQYAKARGWPVVAAPFVDEGVSATHNKPEDRAGWRALLACDKEFDAVLVWKVDRLARRVLDFLNAHEALQARGRGIVAVEDPIDMTTAQGRAFATMLAVFAEMEGEAIRARVAAARSHLLRAGRVVGGAVPYGWMSVKNPDGKGYVLAHDPEKIDYVRQMADRARRGDTLYSIMKWLDQVGAPLPSVSQKNRKRTGWHYSTVERLLRHPVLAGMTPFNPGNDGRQRGHDVLRDKDGLPVVDESVAIMPVNEWRAMVAALDNRNSPQARPRAMTSKSSPLLSGLVRCAYCLTDEGESVRMHRASIAGRPGYRCPVCGQSISRFEDIVIEEFLWAKGDRERWQKLEEVYEGGAAMLPEIEHRLGELVSELAATDDDDEADRLAGDIANLRAMRRDAKEKAPQVTLREVKQTRTYGEDWEDAHTVEEQRAVLDDALLDIWVLRGNPGRRNRELTRARLIFGWFMPDHIGPYGEITETDEELAADADFARSERWR